VITAGNILNEDVFMGFTPMDPIKLGVKDNTTMDISVSQLVFSGEYLVGLQASRVYFQISDQSREKTESDLKESVANTYSLILMLEQNKLFLQQTLENTNKILNELREMYKQGFLENTDVDQLELTSLNIANGVSQVNRQTDQAYTLLKFQLGMPLDQEITLTDNLETLAEDGSLESTTALQFEVKNNIDYKIMETQEALGLLNLKREQSLYLPTLAAVYQHNEKLQQPEFDFSPKDIFALSMSIPIFSSGQRNTKVQERKLELEKISNIRQNVANGLQLEYVNARNELSTAYEKYLNEKKNIELTKRIYEKTLIKMKEGISTSLDLTSSQNQYISAQTSYYAALYSLITAKNKLARLTNNL
jgi:outer membrane protein TolC